MLEERKAEISRELEQAYSNKQVALTVYSQKAQETVDKIFQVGLLTLLIQLEYWLNLLYPRWPTLWRGWWSTRATGRCWCSRSLWTRGCTSWLPATQSWIWPLLPSSNSSPTFKRYRFVPALALCPRPFPSIMLKVVSPGRSEKPIRLREVKTWIWQQTRTAAADLQACCSSAELAAAHRLPSSFLTPAAARDTAASAAAATAAEPFYEQQPPAGWTQSDDASRPACGSPPSPTAASVRQSADGSSELKSPLWRIRRQHESSISIQLPIEFPPQRILNRRPGKLDRDQQHLREVVKWCRFVVRGSPWTSRPVRKPTRLPWVQGTDGDEASVLVQRRDDGVDNEASLSDGHQLAPNASEHPSVAKQPSEPQQCPLPTKKPDQEAEDDLPLQVWRVWDPGGSVHGAQRCGRERPERHHRGRHKQPQDPDIWQGGTFQVPVWGGGHFVLFFILVYLNLLNSLFCQVEKVFQ